MQQVTKICFAIICTSQVIGCEIQPKKLPRYYGNYAISESAKADKITVNLIVGVGSSNDKKITVVKDGKLLVKNIIEPNVGAEFIEIINPSKSLYLSDVHDNVYYPMGGDMKVNYTFYDTYLIGKGEDINDQEHEFFQGYNDKLPTASEGNNNAVKE